VNLQNARCNDKNNHSCGRFYTYPVYLPGQSQTVLQKVSENMKMVKTLRFSKMRVNLYQTTRRYIVGSSTLFLLTNIEYAITNYF
jgi:hypothetical protein